MKKKSMLSLLAMVMVALIAVTSCKKGKDGADGAPGKDGTNGADASATCKLCHNPTVVDAMAAEFEFSKHKYGEAAFEEAGNNVCAVCHTQEGFKYVCKNNVSSAFTLDPVTNKYVNGYQTISSASFGELSCFTCHDNLHTTYAYSDLTTFTTVAPVSMTMWGGAKTIDLQQNGGKSNLCVKCHQPRPMVASLSNGRVLNYDSLRTAPNVIFWDSTAGAVNHYIKPSYRMHTHYGAVGAIYAGIGAVEFSGNPGDLSYTNSPHTTLASCDDCHMAPMTGRGGSHTFFVRASAGGLTSNTTWNFNGCNVTGCHATSPIDANVAKFITTRSTIKGLLDQLAAKINACGNGHDILNVNTDPETNLWAGVTTNNYDGYLNIYDATSNPTGYWKVTSQPKFPTLKNVQVGAIINFQLCLREYSLGIHNTAYTTALLTNTINAMTAAGW